MLKSKIIPEDEAKISSHKKGQLYQSDVHGTNIVVLCTEDESKGCVMVVILRQESDMVRNHKTGKYMPWSVNRLRPFLGSIELSN